VADVTRRNSRTGGFAAAATFRFARNGPIKPPDRHHESYSSNEEYYNFFYHKSFLMESAVARNSDDQKNNNFKPTVQVEMKALLGYFTKRCPKNTNPTGLKAPAGFVIYRPSL
jgi:hypothetical protein